MTENTKEFIEANAAYIKVLSTIKNAEFNNMNPHFKAKFADFISVRKAVRPAFSDEDLAIVQYTEVVEGVNCQVTEVRHINGITVVKSIIQMLKTAKIQELGSFMTYYRRYGLSMVAGICGDEDVDGNAPEEPPKKTKIDGIGAMKDDARDFQKAFLATKTTTELTVITKEFKSRTAIIKAHAPYLLDGIEGEDTLGVTAMYVKHHLELKGAEAKQANEEQNKADMEQQMQDDLKAPE